MTEAPLLVKRVAPARLHDLRSRVLRGGDPLVSVEDPRDDEATSIHFGGLLGERIVVSASFFPSNSPVDGERAAYQLRYMATDFDVRGRGYGAQVMARADLELRGLGARTLWANARDTALGFYLATGWTMVEGSQHISEATQLPHTVIVKRLDLGRSTGD